MIRRLALVALVLVVGTAAIVGIARFTRLAPEPALVLDPLSRVPPPTDSFAALVLERYIGMHVVPGNRVEVLLNGDATFPRLWRDLRAARRTITVQNY